MKLAEHAALALAGVVSLVVFIVALFYVVVLMKAYTENTFVEGGIVTTYRGGSMGNPLHADDIQPATSSW